MPDSRDAQVRQGRGGSRGLDRRTHRYWDGAAFSAAKGGVVNLTRQMALSHASENIRVNCICPGYIATPIIQGILNDPERLEKASARHPMGRIGQPEEVAAAVAFLASDEASFITGAILPIDGGYLAAGR